MKENNENEWGDLECLYKACQAAITEGGFFKKTKLEQDNCMQTCKPKQKYINYKIFSICALGT